MGSDACRICGNTEGNTSSTAHEMQFGTREAFRYFQCRRCECLQIAEIPADLSLFYPASYYSKKPANERKYEGLRGWIRVLPFRAALWTTWPLAPVASWFSLDPHFTCLRKTAVTRASRILDVGCGNGREFLLPLRAMGFANVAGCDPFNDGPIRYRNGLVILNQALESAVVELGGSWDAVTFQHSFEHIHNPQETLHIVARVLDDHGVCIIRIPTCSSQAWETYGVDWVQLDAPRHLFLHSVESMGRMADAAGLALSAVRYDSTYRQFWSSENYRKGIALIDQRRGRGPGWWLWRRKMNRAAAELNAAGRGDQAAFLLTKPRAPSPRPSARRR